MSVASIKRLTPFTPTQISGCQLWFDGADSSILSFSSGSNVSLWGDKSGLGNNLSNSSGTFSTRTTTPGGYPSIFVNGGQLITISNNTTTGNLSRSLFMITQTVGGTSRFGTGPHFGATPPNTYGHDLNVGGNGIFCPYVYTASDVFFTGANSNMYCLFSDYNSATSTLRGIINFSTSITKSTTLNTTASPWYLGLRPDGVGVSSAYVCEIILYNLSLSTSERQQVEGYLAQKWGLTGSLPPFHPGLKSKIYPSIPQNRLFNLIASSSFSPITVTGCQLWLDGADTTSFTYSSGTSIATWRDKVTGIFASNTSPTNQPTLVSSSQNGNSTVFFDAAAALKYIDIPPWSFGTTSRSMFIVMKNIASAVNSNVLGGYPHWLWDRVNGNNANVWTMVGVLQIRPGDFIYFMPRNEYLIIGIIYSSPTMTAYQTGSQVLNYTSLSSFFDATNGYRLGALNNGDDSAPFPYRFYGNIAEVITYNTSVSTLQRQQIEGYLAWKWGLQANLPADHPYKSAAPTSGSTAPARPIISLPRFQYSSSGLVITHMDGRSWKLSGSSIYLNTGTTMSLTIYPGSDVYNSANGRVGLFNNGSSSAAVRHSSYVMFADPFTPNNFDFAWYFVSSGSGYLIYNDYPSISGWQVTYDTGQDRVLITDPGNANYGMVWNITPKLTLSYVYRSYPT